MSLIKVGITGSRYGWNAMQAESFRTLMGGLRVSEFHYGDCVGVDEDSFDWVTCNMNSTLTVSHPPTITRFQAYTEPDETRPALPYMIRNRAIVDSVDLMVVIPRERSETRRSGTWTTWRYAKKKGTLIVLMPGHEKGD
ncbi:hypothetical protein LCGC14_0674310 [marine sediment metagenome]|uniref:Uncharacterized protein n=1 Tax=marine sediment metagenome TaxID=412755 RepID=A0A0F9QV73_9ZZZZ